MWTSTTRHWRKRKTTGPSMQMHSHTYFVCPYVRACVRSSHLIRVLSLAFLLTLLGRPYFFSFILWLARWPACSYIQSFSHLSIRWLAVSGDTFSSVANAVLEDLTMNALLTARVIGHRSGLPCLELYLVQGQQVRALDYFISFMDLFGLSNVFQSWRTRIHYVSSS